MVILRPQIHFELLSVICTFYGVKNGDWFCLYLFHFQDTCGSVPNIFFYEKYNQGEINSFHICNFVDFNFQFCDAVGGKMRARTLGQIWGQFSVFSLLHLCISMQVLHIVYF